MTQVASAEVQISASGEGDVTNKLKGLGNALGGIAKAAAAGALSKYTWELIQMGVASKRAEVALGALTGGKADEYVEAIGEATNNTISRMDAMSVSSKFLSMGLAETSAQAAEMARVAATLGGVFQGLSAGDAAEQFALLLSNMSVQRLDTFGISSAQVRARIEELQKATPGLSREMAFLQATMEIGSATANKFGDVLDDLGARVDQTKANMEDMGASLGVMLAEVAAPATELAADVTEGATQTVQDIGGIIDVWKSHRRELIANSNSYEEFRLAQARSLDSVSLEAQALLAVTGNLAINRRLYDIITTSINNEAGAAKKAAAANKDMADMFGYTAINLSAMREQFRAMEAERVGIAIDVSLGEIPDVQGLFSAVAEMPGSFGLAASDLLEMGVALGIVTPEAQVFAEAWQWAATELGDYNLTGAQTAEIIKDIAGGMSQTSVEAKAMQKAISNMAEDAADRIAALAEQSPVEIEVQGQTAMAEYDFRRIDEQLSQIPATTEAEVDAITEEAYLKAAAIKALLESIAGTYSATVDVGVSGGAGGGGSFNGVHISPTGTAGMGHFGAAGGPVTAGNPYIIGEAGPELFVPQTSGNIVPNFAASGFGSGSSGSQSITITIPVMLDGREVGRGSVSGTLDALQNLGVIQGGMVA